MSTPRMQDVATRAGVSLKTVSNVINDFPHVRPATRQRVEQAITALGYRPNLSARSLARGRCGVIALALPELDMPYFASLSRSLVEQAQAAGWVVLVEQTLGNPELEERALEGRFPYRVDGIILNPVSLSDRRIADRSGTVPVVLLGEHPAGRLVADHVVTDNTAAVRTAVEHLLGLGRQRVAFLGPGTSRPSNTRLRGYKSALVNAGLTPDKQLIGHTDANTGAEGERAMDAVLDRGAAPDAVFCVTDWVALGALRSLAKHGVRVPDDVAVAGFDDIPYGQSVRPSLTTIRTDRSEIAQKALQSLERQLGADSPLKPRRHLVGYQLIARESTLGIPASPAPRDATSVLHAPSSRTPRDQGGAAWPPHR